MLDRTINYKAVFKYQKSEINRINKDIAKIKQCMNMLKNSSDSQSKKKLLQFYTPSHVSYEDKIIMKESKISHASGLNGDQADIEPDEIFDHVDALQAKFIPKSEKSESDASLPGFKKSSSFSSICLNSTSHQRSYRLE